MMRTMAWSAMMAAAIAVGSPVLAQEGPGTQQPPAGQPRMAAPVTIIDFEANNPREPGGDRLAGPRRLAATVVAQDKPNPKLIVDVGSFTGEFLQAFMEQFPTAHGQWTEPVESNRDNAKRRLAKFGSNIDYVIGCPSRDISLGCVPKGVDVMLTSWLSIHQNLAGVQKFYRGAYAMLPSGGWLANLDHVTLAKPWQGWADGARKAGDKLGLNAIIEGPPVHHADYVTPTMQEQLDAIHAAGFTDVQVMWQRLDTVLFMAKKK